MYNYTCKFEGIPIFLRIVYSTCIIISLEKVMRRDTIFDFSFFFFNCVDYKYYQSECVSLPKERIIVVQFSLCTIVNICYCALDMHI